MILLQDVMKDVSGDEVSLDFKRSSVSREKNIDSHGFLLGNIPVEPFLCPLVNVLLKILNHHVPEALFDMRYVPLVRHLHL